MSDPLISVVIPTYNHAKYVAQAVSSALNQDYKKIEVIVVDDGSTDNTVMMLQPFKEQINYLFKTRGGTSSALNLGIGAARGQYVCWLSADDLFREDKVRIQTEQMEADLSLGFVYSSFQIISAEGNVTNTVNSPFFKDHHTMVTQLLIGCFINGSSVMMRKNVLDKVGLFDVRLPQAHDWDMWFRILRHFPCSFFPEPLISYRWHGENLSLHPDHKCEQLVKARAKRLFPEYFSKDSYACRSITAGEYKHPKIQP